MQIIERAHFSICAVRAKRLYDKGLLYCNTNFYFQSFNLQHSLSKLHIYERHHLAVKPLLA